MSVAFIVPLPEAAPVLMLFGVGMILPVIIGYDLYARGIFRGKGYGESTEDEY